jgi:hypothetical protein
MIDPLAACVWPSLPPPADRALRAAVGYVCARFQPVGIVAAGTIVAGRPDPASDLDVFVVHEGPLRQRLQRFFAGVPTELFVNPPAAIERYFADEAARPCTAHMLATGFVVLASPVLDALRARAAAILAGPPPPLDETSSRYAAATLLEDAVDVAARDPAAAALLAGQAVVAMLQHVCRRAGGFAPRGKDVVVAAGAIDGEAEALARAFAAAGGLAERLEIAGRLADRTVGARGFFEWESAPIT